MNRRAPQWQSAADGTRRARQGTPRQYRPTEESRPAAPVPAAPIQQAFTLRVNSDGSVTFSASDVVDPAAATGELNKAGITGRVVNFVKSCSSSWLTHASEKAGLSDGNTITIRSTDYPAGGGVLVVVSQSPTPGGGTETAVIEAPYQHSSDIPTCAGNP